MYHYIACVNINALFRELSLPLSLWSLYDTRRSIHPIPSTYSTTVGGQRAILSEVLLADLKEHAKIIFLTSSIPPWPTIVFVEKTRWEKIHEKMLSVNGTEPDVRRPWPLVTVATLVRAALLFNCTTGTSQPSDKSSAYFESSDGWSHLVMVSPKAKKLWQISAGSVLGKCFNKQTHAG